MKKTFAILVATAVVAIFSLAGCGSLYWTPPVKHEVVSMPMPLPPTAKEILPIRLAKNWQATVKEDAKLIGHYKDPYSLKFRFLKKPVPCYIADTPYNGDRSKLTAGYCGIVGINGKNSFGAYVGEKLHLYQYYYTGKGGVALVSEIDASGKAAWDVTPSIEELISGR